MAKKILTDMRKDETQQRKINSKENKTGKKKNKSERGRSSFNGVTSDLSEEPEGRMEEGREGRIEGRRKGGICVPFLPPLLRSHTREYHDKVNKAIWWSPSCG